jgi:hypothetical protein
MDNKRSGSQPSNKGPAEWMEQVTEERYRN